MLFQEMNIDALQRTFDLMFGPQVTNVVAKTYLAMEAAMQAAHEQGYREGYELGKWGAEDLAKIDAEQNVEERIDAAFDNGFAMGMAQAEDQSDLDYEAGVRDATENANIEWANGYLEGINEGYDDGYLEGVREARAFPAIADETVEVIIAERDKYAFNGDYDADLVTDSGDEHYDFDYFN